MWISAANAITVASSAVSLAIAGPDTDSIRPSWFGRAADDVRTPTGTTVTVACWDPASAVAVAWVTAAPVATPNARVAASTVAVARTVAEPTDSDWRADTTATRAVLVVVAFDTVDANSDVAVSTVAVARVDTAPVDSWRDIAPASTVAVARISGPPTVSDALTATGGATAVERTVAPAVTIEA